MPIRLHLARYMHFLVKKKIHHELQVTWTCTSHAAVQSSARSTALAQCDLPAERQPTNRGIRTWSKTETQPAPQTQSLLNCIVGEAVVPFPTCQKLEAALTKVTLHLTKQLAQLQAHREAGAGFSPGARLHASVSSLHKSWQSVPAEMLDHAPRKV